MQYYEYQIVLVAMRKTRRSAGSEGSTNIKPRLYLCGKRGNLQDHGVLRISNCACSNAENATICRIMEYYEYKSALVTITKSRESLYLRVLYCKREKHGNTQGNYDKSQNVEMYNR